MSAISPGYAEPEQMGGRGVEMGGAEECKTGGRSLGGGRGRGEGSVWRSTGGRSWPGRVGHSLVLGDEKGPGNGQSGAKGRAA